MNLFYQVLFSQATNQLFRLNVSICLLFLPKKLLMKLLPAVVSFLQKTSEGWWAWQGSDLRPTGYEPAALTTELQAPKN